MDGTEGIGLENLEAKNIQNTNRTILARVTLCKNQSQMAATADGVVAGTASTTL